MNLVNQIIKHTKNMDVAYKVLDRMELANGLSYLFVDVLNQGYVSTWPLNVRLHMKVDLAQDWLYCTDPSAPCLRYADWRPLWKIP